MSDTRHTELSVLLVHMEQDLRTLGLWETVAPAPHMLASEIPFCHDTLEFTQWLQWVLIPRFRAVIEGAHPLPTRCSIAPIAEDAFARLDRETDALLERVRAVDRLLTVDGPQA